MGEEEAVQPSEPFRWPVGRDLCPPTAEFVDKTVEQAPCISDVGAKPGGSATGVVWVVPFKNDVP